MKLNPMTKKVAVILLLLLPFNLLTGFGLTPGLGDVSNEFSISVAPALVYDQQVSIHPVRGVERSYLIEANLTEQTKPYVYSGKITDRWKLSSAIRNVTQEGYTVVAGINGDFYDTKLGTPLGMVIHQGKLKASGLNTTKAVGFLADGTAFVAPIQFQYELAVNGMTTIPVHHVNKPQAMGDAIHFYNDQFDETTGTTVANVEVVVQTQESNEPVINGTIQGVVSTVNPASSNGILSQGQFLLSTSAGTSNAALLAALVPGDQVTFTVRDLASESLWFQAAEAIGAYQVIAENGAVTVAANGADPRTCLGIRPDGSLLLYAVDGRNPGFSNGLGLADIATYLVSRGCVTVVNLDGGGSTTIAVRMPGDTEAKVTNRPSGGVERSNSNSLLFVETAPSSGILQQIHLYPLSSYAMPGAAIPFVTKATDDRYRPVSNSASVSYQVSGTGHQIDPTGLLTLGSTAETIQVKADQDGKQAEAVVRVTDQFQFQSNVSTLTLDPGQTKGIDLSLSYLGNPVVGRDELFQWSCDPLIGTIDADGLFRSAQTSGVSGNIVVSFRERSLVIPVQIGAQSIDFMDTADHWARNYIGVLAARKIVSGMGEGLYLPEHQLTRAQFVKLLASTIPNLDLAVVPKAGFQDVVEWEWYAPYVNWAVQQGIVKGTSPQTFAPNEPITREQMAVMLTKYAAAVQLEIVPVVSGKVFADEDRISAWATGSVQEVVAAGIMTGTPEGSFEPGGNATRAQAAKVIYQMVIR